MSARPFLRESRQPLRRLLPDGLLDRLGRLGGAQFN